MQTVFEFPLTVTKFFEKWRQKLSFEVGITNFCYLYGWVNYIFGELF